MSQDESDPAPATLKVRAFQAGGKMMVTTFLCPKNAPKSVLKAWFRRRWNAELDLRTIKTPRGLERRRCKTPQRALKELGV